MTPILGDEDASLTVGDLAARTGVAAGTLRMWEKRHGFPVPVRLESGHRRYRESDVEAVRRVVEARDRGTRLDRAVAEVLAPIPVGESVYGLLRQRYDDAPSHQMRKGTLTALSHAIEDEFCSTADRGRLLGGFQTTAFFEPAAPRWTQFARISQGVTVFAEHADGAAPMPPSIQHIPIPPEARSRREWFVVCESTTMPVVMAGWEVPGHRPVHDMDRSFEVSWSLDAAMVSDAVRVCQRIASGVGHHLDPPESSLADAGPGAGSSLFLRALAYADRRAS